MGLLTDIYNTVARFFRSQEGIAGDDASKSVAQNRLKLVLMQDRTNLTPKVLEQMRGELVDLLSKYLEMDKDLLELNFEHEGDQVALMLSIPVIRAKDEEEIEEAINASKSSEDESENESDDEENENIETESEEFEENEEAEEAPKPKKRRSKKVTPPEELENCDVNCEENAENSSQEENQEQAEIICENTES